MNFWDRISRLLDDLPEEDRKFTEYAWLSFSRIAGQLWFDTQNAIASISPDDIPIYDIRYWQKFEDPWSVPTGVYSIPKLQDLVFAETITEYVEGTDYNIVAGTIVWDVAAPTSGYAWAEQVFYYNGYLESKLGYDLRFIGINTAGYTPIHAHHLARALNYAYRSSDTILALKAGITAILGLPFAYVAGAIKSKTTASGNHTVVITDTVGDDHDIVIVSTLCALSDLPAVGASVSEFEPLIDAVKVGETKSQAFLPKLDTTYPTDGDMEAVGVANWTAINGAVLSKDTSEEYGGAKCLKIVTDATGEGVKPAANRSVTAGDEYVFDFYIKRKSTDDTIVRANIWNVTAGSTITSEWFGGSTYEHGYLRFTVPAGCLNVRIEFLAEAIGTFYVDNLDLYQIKELSYYAADKTANSIKASYTISASGRAGTKDLVFSAADHIYGTNGNYISLVIVASGADQALSSTISGTGTSSDPYIYTLTTGNQNGQSSNDEIVAFVNSDPNALQIITAYSLANDTTDPTYSLGSTSLSGGLNAKISTYESVFYITGDKINVRNFTLGTEEIRKITGVAGGSAPYSKILSLDNDLFASYTSPETGTSSSVGAGFLADSSKSWTTNEHQGDVLIDSADESFKVASNNGTTLVVTGTPASGTYRIVKDHVGVIFGERAADYTNVLKIYNRWTTTFNQDNVDAYIANIGDLGHKLEFEDVS